MNEESTVFDVIQAAVAQYFADVSMYGIRMRRVDRLALIHRIRNAIVEYTRNKADGQVQELAIENDQLVRENESLKRSIGMEGEARLERAHDIIKSLLKDEEVVFLPQTLIDETSETYLIAYTDEDTGDVTLKVSKSPPSETYIKSEDREYE